MSFIKKILVTFISFGVVGCTGIDIVNNGNSSRSSKGGGSYSKHAKPKSTLLDSSTLKKEFTMIDSNKILNIKNDIASALQTNDMEKINTKLKGLNEYAIKNKLVNDYRVAYRDFKDATSAIKRHEGELQKANKAKQDATKEYNTAQQQLNDAKSKFEGVKPDIKNLAKSKNTEPHGKTKELNKAIEADNYPKMVHYLLSLKLVPKDDANISKYSTAKKNMNLADENLKDFDRKLKEADKSVKEKEKGKALAEKKKQQAEQVLNQSKGGIVNYVNNNLENELNNIAIKNPKLQKIVNLKNFKMVDKSDNNMLIYDLIEKGKTDDGKKIVDIRVKKLIYNSVSNPSDKNYMFKFAAENFKQTKDGILANRNGKAVKVKYKESSPGNYIFEFENGYAGVSGVEQVATLNTNYSLLLSGSSVGLSYSDFGYLDEFAKAKNGEGKDIKSFRQFRTIVGGYDEKKVNISNVNLDKDIQYTGKIVGFVSNKLGTSDSNKWKNEKISGNVSLTLKKDKTEDVDISFKDYYNMKFKSHATSDNVNNLVLEDKRQENSIYKDYTIDNSGTGKFSKTYYGDDKLKAGSEASGRFNYNQGNISVDSTFGVKR